MVFNCGLQHGWAILDTFGDCTFSILLLHLGFNAVIIFKVSFKKSYTIINFLTGLFYLGEGQLMVLLSFFILEFKVFSFSIFLQCLIFLPILDTFLEPLLHEASIASNFVDLSRPHVQEGSLLRWLLVSIALFGKRVLFILLIVIFLEMFLHYDLFLRFV